MDGVVYRAGEGEELFGGRILIKSGLPDLCITESFFEGARDGASPHYHERHADSFYVLEGELEFRLGDETVRAPAGTSVVVPPGVVHAFTNARPDRARFLNVHAPESDFVEFLRAVMRGDDIDPVDYDIHNV